MSASCHDASLEAAQGIVERALADLSFSPIVTSFFDEKTFTVTHLVRPRQGNACAVIDSVLDFNPVTGRVQSTSADAVAEYILQHDLQLAWLLETHVHADHLSAASLLQRRLGGRLAIGARITRVQETFAQVFNAGPRFACDGSQFDHLFADGARFTVGRLEAMALHVPGHTPACTAYVIGDAVFPGDTLFMPDHGTARCDFPGGDSATLFRSVRRLFQLPAQTRVFLCHDYQAPSRNHFAWETTIGRQRTCNIHIHQGVQLEDFVALRDARDATLATPHLMLPAVQVNIRGGRFPEPEANGVSYLKIPLRLP